MSDEKKTPEEISDDDLDAAQGGYTVELVDATISEVRTTQTTGTKSYDEAGPGIVHRTATKLEPADVERIDGMHIDPVIP